MPWRVNQYEGNIIHIVPIDDTIEHLEEHEEDRNTWIFNDGPMRKGIQCKCPCRKVIKYLENGGIIITHDALDGRLGVEWTNEILNNKDGK